MKKIQAVQIGVLLSFIVSVPGVSPGCAPLPVLLYPADEVYKEKGWAIPELPDDAIALIDGEYISRDDYKTWLYEKMGFTLEIREAFLINRTLKELLQKQGVDTEREHAYILENFFQIETRGNIYTHYNEWHDETRRMEEWNSTEPPLYQASVKKRVHESYLPVLYLLQNWDEVRSEILKPFEVSSKCLDAPGDDPELNRLIKMNNAYQVYLRYSDRVNPYISKKVLSTEDPNMPEYTQEFTDWLYKHYSTVFLMENYLGTRVSNRYAEKNNITISEEVAAAEFEKRLAAYREQVTEYNLYLDKSVRPLSISPVYTNFIMKEVRDDLRKSSVHRSGKPLKPYEITKKFYDQYGFLGQRCRVKEIFKWVRMRHGVEVSSEHAEYLAEEETRVRQELTTLRNLILAEGVETFPVYAISENQNQITQNTCGFMNSVIDFGEEYAATLNALALHEVSPVLKGPWDTLDLFWVAEKNGKGSIFHIISKSLPPMTGFDDVAYRRDLAAARAALEELKRLIEGGESIDKLAEVHSDSFNRRGVDISTRYQTGFGYEFAKELVAMPDGGLKIIPSQEGLHLVQVISREVTPFTEEVKNKVIKRYQQELADQNDRYDVVKKMFFEVNPYFKSTQTY